MKLYELETYYSCINAIAEELANEPLGADCKTVVFCEDKFTLSIEEAIAFKTGGTFNAEVKTFARYVSSFNADSRAIGKDSSAIVVKKVLGNLKGELKALSKAATSPMFAFETSELIAQLKSAKITPDELLNAAENCKENIRAKIFDIALVYKKYEEFLEEKGLIDQSGVLDKAPDLIERDDKIKNSKVYIVAYSSLTKQVCKIAESLERSSQSVVVYAVNGKNKNLYTGEFFEFIKKRFNCDPIKPDCDLLAEQCALLNGLFDHNQFLKVGLYTDKVAIFEAKTVREEVDFIAKRITYLVTEKGYRYSDFCLAVGDAKKYRLQIKQTFGDYGIPFFSDEKYSLSSHPLARLTLSVLRAVAKNGDLNEIKDVIANPLFIADKSKADKMMRIFAEKTVTRKLFLDNSFAFSDEEFINGKRKTLGETVMGFKRADKACEYVAKLKKFFVCAETEQNAAELALKLSEINAEIKRAFLTSAMKKTIEIIEKTGEVLGDDEITAAEFEKLLDTGFRASETGLIPQMRDCVYVADLKDCKGKRFKVLFAAGLNGEVPFVKSDAALLQDSDIADLEELSLSVEPKISLVNRREKESVGISLASFSEQLFLSYCISSFSGGQSARSEIIDYVQAMFTNKNGEPIKPFSAESVLKSSQTAEGKRKDVLEGVDYMRYRPAYFSFIKTCEDYKNGAISSLTACSSFYQAVKNINNEEKTAYIEETTEKINKEKTIRKNIPVENYFSNGRASASKIECFYSCPYKCFVKYALGAKDKLMGDVKSLDFGNALHGTAELFVKNMGKIETDEDAERIANDAVCAALNAEEIQKFSHRGDFAYALKLTEKEGKKLCSKIYGEFKKSKFKPIGQEIEFAEGKEYKPIVLNTDNGQFKLSGKADRVDKYENYVRIIDYKTGNAADKAKDERFYTGQNLQLYLYLNAFVREGEKAAGAYYYQVNDSFKKEGETSVSMTGKTLETEEIINATDPDIKENGKSDVVNVSVDKRNGKLTGGVVDGVALSGYMKYAKKLAEKAVDNIANGVVVPSPYQKTCDYCEYGSICGFDADSDFNERKITNVKQQAIVEAAFSDEKKQDDGVDLLSQGVENER